MYYVLKNPLRTRFVNSQDLSLFVLPSVGTVGPSLSYGKGINFIYQLESANKYDGAFVTITVGGSAGAYGAYGTIFTTPERKDNFYATGNVGDETWGWGAGGYDWK